MAVLSPAAFAGTHFQPAVLYDLGGKFDKSVNESVAAGIAAFAGPAGIEVREFEITNETQREQTLRNMARRGDDPILAVGSGQASALAKVAKEFPQTRFTIVDATVKAPNVLSIVFRDHESAFLIGALSAMSSRSAKIGFVGGMDVPRIRRIACGYVQGAKHLKPEIAVLQNMTGTTASAWNDPTKGAELAQAQFDRGVDVVFHAAGGTGLGVLQAAADARRFAIGNEVNQNGLFPGIMLSSMLRRVDQAAYNAVKSAADGTWRPGTLSLGLKERGIDWVLDENNAHFISAEMKALMDKIKAEIVSGAIKVVDSTATGKCPY